MKHAPYQSESSLRSIVDVYIRTQRPDYATLALDAQTELTRRANMGGYTCDCCRGQGWLRDRAYGCDEICIDCGGTGTVISERELKRAQV